MRSRTSGKWYHWRFDRSLFLTFLSLTKPPQRHTEQTDWQSHVLPHTPIEELAPNLWHVTGILGPVIPPREMVVYRLPDTTLLIHSAIALNEPEMNRLESLGLPKILLVPNRIHRLDAGLYKQRYPNLQVICPAVAQSYVEQVVPVDGIAEEVLPDYGIVCHKPAGIYEQDWEGPCLYRYPLQPNGDIPEPTYSRAQFSV